MQTVSYNGKNTMSDPRTRARERERRETEKIKEGQIATRRR